MNEADTKFLHMIIRLGARAAGMGRHEAAGCFVCVAQQAIDSPQASPPWRHYLSQITQGLNDMFGIYSHQIARLSRGKQFEAVSAHICVQDAYARVGLVVDWGDDELLDEAIRIMRAEGEGWRDRFRAVFDRALADA